MSHSTETVFATYDYENTRVVLSQTTWRKKAGNHSPGDHPEIRDYLDDIK